MSASVHHLGGGSENGHNPTHEDVKAELELLFSKRRWSFGETTLGNFQTYQIAEKPIWYVTHRKGEPYCIVSQDVIGVLFGNRQFRELSMPLSCFRTAGSIITPILKSGSFDALQVKYFAENLCMVVEAEFLLERLKRFT